LGAADPPTRAASATLTSGAESARATTLTHVEASSPLALAMTETPDPVSLGGLVTYSLTVTNTGGQDASGVALHLRVPEGLYSTSGCRAVSDAGVFPAACTQGRDVDWDLGTLPAASSRTVQFVGQVTVAGLPDGQLLRANARVRDAAGDAARAQLATTIATNAPLVLTLDEHDDPVVTNGTLEYVLRFGNRSASPLLTTSLALTLPSGVTVLDDGGAVVTGSTAVWTLGTLGAHTAGE